MGSTTVAPVGGIGYPTTVGDMEALTQWLAAPGYEVARTLVQRGLALVYVVAFTNAWFEFPALLGERGLMPARRVVARTGFWSTPTLFHWRYDDRVVRAVAAGGVAGAAGLAVGLGDLVPLAVSVAWWLALWFAYLSIVNVGQTFYGFGWESLLVEAGFLVAFLGNDEVAPPIVVLVLLRWLLFRVEFGAGLIKWRGDRCWRDLTCLDFHHETQPMPGPLSWWFHHLPPRVHRVEVAANHVVQLGLPWMLFLPQPFAGMAGAAVVVTQAWLLVSGNYSWLNATTLLLGAVALPDAWFGAVVDPTTGATSGPSWFVMVVVAVGLLLLVLSVPSARNLLSRRQRMNASFNRWRLVNAYGAFGSVTRSRREVVVEGTMVEDPDEGDWRTYEFPGKPTDPSRRPPQVAPYHRRLDWLLWFVPLSPRYAAGWFDTFLNRLASGDPLVRTLLRHDPFDGDAPTWLRARLVDYRFSTREERRANGDWWVAGHSRELVPPRRGAAGLPTSAGDD